MPLKTKYNIGDEVWWFWLGSIVPANGVMLGYNRERITKVKSAKYQKSSTDAE